MKTKLIVFILLALMLAGCGGKSGWISRDVPNDPNYIYAWGQAESRQLQLATNRAADAARQEIGRSIEVRLMGMQKNFAEEVGSGSDSELLSMYTEATKSVVSQVLNGSRIKTQEHREDKGLYQARVLVEYPIGAANEALMAQIKNRQNLYTRFRASEGFKDLEEEVQKYEEWQERQRN